MVTELKLLKSHPVLGDMGGCLGLGNERDLRVRAECLSAPNGVSMNRGFQIAPNVENNV